MRNEYFQDILTRFCNRKIIDYFYQNNTQRIINKYITKQNNTLPIYRFSLIDTIYKMKSKYIASDIIQENYKKQEQNTNYNSYNTSYSYTSSYNTSFSNISYNSYNTSYTISYSSSYNNSYNNFDILNNIFSDAKSLNIITYKSSIGYPMSNYKNADIIKKSDIDEKYFTLGYGLELI